MTTQPQLAAEDNVLPFTPRPVTAIVDVDPPTATEWLTHNTNNRPVRPKVLASYIRDMKAGHWQLTGEAIKFAVDGSLLDGQHRLEAVVRSGATVQMVVISGLGMWIDTRRALDKFQTAVAAAAARCHDDIERIHTSEGRALCQTCSAAPATRSTRATRTPSS